jgi:hypothetical protein
MRMPPIAPRKGETHLQPIANGAMQQNGWPNGMLPNYLLAVANQERETMRIMLRAAIAALSFASIGPAFAGEGDGGTVANTFFTDLPGVVAQAPVQNAPAVATAQNGQAMHAYITQSGRGTWLFAPNPNGDGTNN